MTELIKTGKLKVFRTLRGLRDELGSYRRPTDSAGNPLEGIVNKRTYHRLDALRYAACGILNNTPIKNAMPGRIGAAAKRRQ